MNRNVLELILLGPASDVRHRFAHGGYAACLERLLEASRMGSGFTVLTGAPGTGKSTLTRELAGRLEAEGHCVGRVLTSQLDAEDLLRLVGFAFGLEAQYLPRDGLLPELEYRLSLKCPRGKTAILIIDEAHDLTAGALEGLFRLGGSSGWQSPNLQILLCGRDGLWNLLDQPQHTGIRQRILASCRLEPLALAEMGPYAAQVLESAGWTGEPAVPAETLELIHVRARGVPRLINLVLGHLLIEGRLAGRRALGPQDLDPVLARLGQDHPELRGQDNLAPPERAIALTYPAPRVPAVSAVLDQLIRSAGGRGRSQIPHSRAPAEAPGGLPWGPVSSGRGWILLGLSVALLVAVLTRLDLRGGEAERLVPAARFDQDRGAGYTVVADGWMEPPVSEPAPVSFTQGSEGVPGPLVGEAKEQAHRPGSEVTATGQGDQVGAGLPAPRAVPTGAAGDAELVRATEVARLLGQAERAFAANRLTVPEGDNAYGYYQAALTLDPNNPQANAGVQRILTRYRGLARQRLGTGDLSGARRLASRGLAIAPRDAELLAIKRKAARPASKRPEPQEPPLMARLEKWFRSGSSQGSHFLE